ncbi:DUF4158 domain-containing protein [Pseudomonas aeruginosa]|nr:DUF4158 domain-containing protein [Pseudomonas aeruginosa]
MNLAVLFKTFQVLRYFPEIAEVPEPVVDFIRTQIGLRSKVALSPYKWMQLYRHMSAVREKLGVRPFYGSDGQDIASTHAQLMAPSSNSALTLLMRSLTSCCAKTTSCPPIRP